MRLSGRFFFWRATSYTFAQPLADLILSFYHQALVSRLAALLSKNNVAFLDVIAIPHAN